MARSLSTRALGVAEKLILGVTGGGAVAVAVVDLVMLVIRLIDLASGPVTIPDVPTAGPLDAGFAGATFDAVAVTLADPSPGTRAFLMGSAVLGVLLAVGICAVVAWLSVRILLGKPFGAVATWGIGGVAILVFFSGLGAPLLNGMAGQRAAFDLGVAQLPTFLVVVDLAPLAWALALAVVAGAFEIGQRMQRDTEALV